MKYTESDINFVELHKTRIALKADGDDLGSNDGINWVIATGRREVFKIVVHVNFNGTLCGHYVFNDFSSI